MPEPHDTPPAHDAAQAGRPVLHVRDHDAKTSYANVCLVTSTREEMILSFGLSFPSASREKPEAQLLVSNRVIMSLPAAKRLAIALSQAIQRFENAHGVIELPQARPAPPSEG
jgi:hypothetical protein